MWLSRLAPQARFCIQHGARPRGQQASQQQQKRPSPNAEVSSRSAKSPRPSDFRAPSLGPFSRDVNARAETIASAVSATHNPFRMNQQSVPAPFAPMNGDSVMDDTQELSQEPGQDTTNEIVCGFRTVVRAIPATGEEKYTRIPRNGVENPTTDQPEKDGKSDTSTIASTTQTTPNPADKGKQSEVGQNLAKEMPPPCKPRTFPSGEGHSPLMAKAESGSLRYDPAATTCFLIAHLRSYTRDTLNPINFSFSVHHLWGARRSIQHFAD
ncbi:hypothetical protein FBEOM_4345 [Fusarium beomiforme]|uniref:Uncharacterized protein n=1 Tax=Fusarium beomiforme TaxID=44412 RepID=A0A9P5ANA3_9HYPO|nr:hypothetical protein FBEOM_4345 [Fusarium beomiforme]